MCAEEPSGLVRALGWQRMDLNHFEVGGGSPHTPNDRICAKLVLYSQSTSFGLHKFRTDIAVEVERRLGDAQERCTGALLVPLDVPDDRLDDRCSSHHVAC